MSERVSTMAATKTYRHSETSRTPIQATYHTRTHTHISKAQLDRVHLPIDYNMASSRVTTDGDKRFVLGFMMKMTTTMKKKRQMPRSRKRRGKKFDDASQ
jgi:hypothetical protein